MEKIRNKLYLVIALLLLLNLWLFLSGRKDKSDLLGLVDDLSEIIRETPVSLFEAVLYEQIMCYEVERCVIDSASIFNEDGEKLNVYDVLDDDYKLVVRYGMFECRQCVDSVVSIVNRNFDSRSVVHMVRGRNMDELKTYKRINQLRADIYRVETVSGALDNINMPYLFLMNKNGEFVAPFVPHKEMLSQIESYFKAVKEKYNLN